MATYLPESLGVKVKSYKPSWTPLGFLGRPGLSYAKPSGKYTEEECQLTANTYSELGADGVLASGIEVVRGNDLALGTLDAHSELRTLHVHRGDLEGIRHRGGAIVASRLAHKAGCGRGVDLERHGLTRRRGTFVVDAGK